MCDVGVGVGLVQVVYDDCVVDDDSGTGELRGI